MYHLLVLVNHGGAHTPLADTVSRAGMSCAVQVDLEDLDTDASPSPDAVLLDLESLDPAEARRFVDQCKNRSLPVLAAVSRETLPDYDPALNPDELVVCPVMEEELPNFSRTKVCGS